MDYSNLIIVIVGLVCFLMSLFFFFNYKNALRKFSERKDSLEKRTISFNEQMIKRALVLNQYNWLKHNLMESLVVQDDIIL